MCWPEDFWNKLCFMHHFTSWSFLELIEYDFKRPWRFKLATECWLHSVGRALAWSSRGHRFNPNWGQFLTKYFLQDLSDNLTEMRIVKNNNESKLYRENWLRVIEYECLSEVQLFSIILDNNNNSIILDFTRYMSFKIVDCISVSIETLMWGKKSVLMY